MDFGVATSTRGATSTREGYIAVAEAAERLGFGFLSVNDHVVVPGGIASKYPYSGDHKWAGASVGECLDLITTLAFLAGRTERLQLLSSVMVVPQRQPVLTAKMLASVDVLSQGRLIVGCGVGWLKEEFEALSAPPYAERGRVTDEFIAAFKVLWTQDRPAFHGRHARFKDLIFAPKPVRKPHPPIWIGGESPLALQRVVRLGDAWYPASNNPQHRLDTAQRVGAGVQELRRVAEAAGRDPASIDVAFLVLWPVTWTAQGTADSERRLLTGSPEAMAADIGALAAAGVRHLCLTFQAGTLAETLERMQRFAEEVMPLVP
ncbi:MAG TPA: LLM class F420-dependent oxidoreductase [Hyphomicrobiaceae bacterium]|jgi:probable F420-dependent oxidoreductase|nr:LLM class F420-dependent oxidoreductase [Hyphomicrobiaceae bacterium]